jgi:4-hydroxy-2-oxoheptanedioate aldolase
MNVPENLLKTKLLAGHQCFGIWMHTASPEVAELLAAVGLDFVIIDQEHGPGDLREIVAAMQAIEGSGTTAMVRVPSSDPIYLKRIVDAGANAILMPMVDTADEARVVVDACLYPPRGERGNAASVVRASRYGLVGDCLERASEQMLIVPQVETVEAVRNAAEVAAVPGVDAVFVGPSDLSGSAGLPGQTSAPEVEALIRSAFASIVGAGKPVATVPRGGRTWARLFDDGFQMVVKGGDIAFVRQGALSQAREWAERATKEPA